jgi:hypothetical protein
VLRALSRDPAARQGSAAELLRAFERLADRTATRGQLLDWLGQSLLDAFDGGDTQVDPAITGMDAEMVVEEAQLIESLPKPRRALSLRRLWSLAWTLFGFWWIALLGNVRRVTREVGRRIAAKPRALPPPTPGTDPKVALDRATSTF